MADVVRLETWARRPPRRGTHRTGPAVVLFFTGVRYERLPAAPPPLRAGQRPEARSAGEGRDPLRRP